MDGVNEPVLFSNLDPQAAVLWAKSGEDQGHPLLAHMLDVAAVAEAILELEPVTTHQHLASQFGMSVEGLPVGWRRLLVCMMWARPSRDSKPNGSKGRHLPRLKD